MSGIIDPDTRVSILGGAFDGRFQIPNNPGQIPSLGLNVLGITSFNSNVLNEVQHESNQFGVLSLQKHIDDIDMQISAFVRNSVLSFSPDVIGDLLFNGVTPFARRSDLAEGVQADASCWQHRLDLVVRPDPMNRREYSVDVLLTWRITGGAIASRIDEAIEQNTRNLTFRCPECQRQAIHADARADELRQLEAPKAMSRVIRRELTPVTLVYRKFSMIYGSSRRIRGLGCWGHYGRHSPSRSGSSMQS